MFFFINFSLTFLTCSAFSLFWPVCNSNVLSATEGKYQWSNATVSCSFLRNPFLKLKQWNLTVKCQSAKSQDDEKMGNKSSSSIHLRITTFHLVGLPIWTWSSKDVWFFSWKNFAKCGWKLKASWTWLHWCHSGNLKKPFLKDDIASQRNNFSWLYFSWELQIALFF